MDLFPEANKSEPTSEESSEDEVFSLSQAATVGVQGRKTIKLTGLVNGQEILILIDSGSSSSFLSQKTADTLKCDLTSASPITVTVANGEKILSQQQVLNFTWWTQGHTFSTNVRILSLSYSDMVLGMN